MASDSLPIVPQVSVLQWRNWYSHLFARLLSSLQSKLDADSLILQQLNDYALLLQTECKRDLPAPELFDIGEVLEQCLKRVHQQHTRTSVLIKAQLQPGMPRVWQGHPALIQALLCHLLLLAVDRTVEGVVFLRLEADADAGMRMIHWLRIKLEDSGPPLQRWQLREWLADRSDNQPPISPMQDFS